MTDQPGGVDPLEHVAAGAGPQRLEEVVLVVVHRQHDDLDRRVRRRQLPHEVQAAVATEPHVAEHDVGGHRIDDPPRLLERGGRPHDDHVVVEVGQHGCEPVQDHLVVVDEHEAKHTATSIGHGEVASMCAKGGSPP